MREVYDRGLQRQAIAAIGLVVERARADGDMTAAEILTKAGEELTRAAASVITRLEMRGQAFGTVLAGGMFRVIPWLAENVTERLAEVAPRTTATTLTVEPAVGAVHLAVRELRGGVKVPSYLEGVAR